MTDEADLKLARECAAEAFVMRNGLGWTGEDVHDGYCDDYIEVQSALRAIKAERARRDAQTVAWLRAPSNRARTAVSLADAIERGEVGE